ncbi:MAG: lytic transglycosylase domain-containing protein [Acetobacter papayae]|uniref:lytic transglycosylase domain-containing protein n=1 Tax=Acetobacter papayae TaxID=1076592 RepID=UPI0039E80072
MPAMHGRETFPLPSSFAAAPPGRGMAACPPRTTARLWARLFILAALATLSACAGPRRTYAPPVSSDNALNQWTPYVQEASRRFTIPQAWIRAIMRQESGGHQYLHGHLTRSIHGAVGLMQIKPDTYAELAGRYHLGSDPYDPHDNIMAGSGYIHELYNRFGSPDFAGAYSCGPQCMSNHRTRGTPLPSYAVAYLAAVSPHLNDPVPGDNTQIAQAVAAAEAQNWSDSDHPQSDALNDAQADTVASPPTGSDTRQVSIAPLPGQSSREVALSGPAITWRQNRITGNAVIQIGAFSTRGRAAAALRTAHGASPALGQAHDRVEQILSGSGASVWRTRIEGLPSTQTDAICQALHQQGLACLPVH